ncbi:lipase B precursor [Pyrenochaeta sp. MPI-SDFR-AT-0127]|nr:lipase B precursor [Pyrenochaeta sp. MPI-SDFR-AT-0127]
MRFVILWLALLNLFPFSLAAPAKRQWLTGIFDLIKEPIRNLQAALVAKDPIAVANALISVTPTSQPTDIAGCVSRLSNIWASPNPQQDFFQAVATQVASGLVLDGTLNTALNGGLSVGENSIDNNNPPPPSVIFPKKDPTDAPFSLSEDALRKAIYIPSGFTYGAKRPVIFVPGTGSYGGSAFGNNLRKLLTGKSYADPVWLNIPEAMLADAQTNSEYIAYAINYISAVSQNNNKIAVISWSQGSLDTQWVLKYWPSTRTVVTDFLPISADFKGTVLGNVLCLSATSAVGLNPCAPSVVQQLATSRYVSQLRSNGGDSAYVPTTTFYSGFLDEIVQPQQGSTASAFLNDARGVGVLNNEVQVRCAGRLGGSFYGHAGVLFHPLTYALIVDALNNDGPGSLSRIDVASVCSSYAAPGLDLDDVIATSGLIPVAGVLLLSYPQKLFTEPPLRSYAV